MTEDPFYIVTDDVQQSLSTAEAQMKQWKVLPMNDKKKSLLENEIRTTLKTIEWDLSDLSDALEEVNKHRDRFNIDDNEVNRRKRLIAEIRSKIQEILVELSHPNGTVSQKPSIDNKMTRKPRRSERDILFNESKSDKYIALDRAIEMDNDNFIYGQEQQQTLIRQQQDEKLDILLDGVSTLHNITSEMSSALDEEANLLKDLDDNVDQTTNNLKSVVHKVDNLLDRVSGTCGECMIFILIVVLLIVIVLLVAL